MPALYTVLAFDKCSMAGSKGLKRRGHRVNLARHLCLWQWDHFVPLARARELVRYMSPVSALRHFSSPHQSLAFAIRPSLIYTLSSRPRTHFTCHPVKMSNSVRRDAEAKETTVNHREECDSPHTQHHPSTSSSNSSEPANLTSDLNNSSEPTHCPADEAQIFRDLEATRATNAAIEAEIATTLAEKKRLEAEIAAKRHKNRVNQAQCEALRVEIARVEVQTELMLGIIEAMGFIDMIAAQPTEEMKMQRAAGYVRRLLEEDRAWAEWSGWK